MTNHKVLLDCCTIIAAKDGRPDAVAFQKKLSRRKDLELLVPDLVVKEVSRIAGIPVEEAERLARSFSSGTVSLLADDESIIQEASELGHKYLSCHFPDSHYLVHCRNTSAVLVTYDKKLKQVARMEGIMTCSPGNYRFYQ
jgi:predicted nucleic acid-binding protein